MSPKRKRIFLVLFLLSLVLLYVFVEVIPKYLTYNYRVNASVLVVEGWMPVENLDKALKIFTNENYSQLIVTGHLLDSTILLSVNSYLIIHLPEEMNPSAESGSTRINLIVSNTLSDADSAHFAVWVNDKEVGDYYTPQSRSGVSFNWEGRVEEIDSLMIQFDNDTVIGSGDRNLLVEKIELNGEDLLEKNPVRYINRGRNFGRNRRNITAITHAELARNYFVEKGVDEQRVYAVNNFHQDKKRTYGNALALKKWLENGGEETQGINSMNVFSTNYHSRRTWDIYNALLGEDIEVGIISVETNDKKSRIRKAFEISREAIALFYYRLFLIPFI